jgi:hypothetical protein
MHCRKCKRPSWDKGAMKRRIYVATSFLWLSFIMEISRCCFNYSTFCLLFLKHVNVEIQSLWRHWRGNTCSCFCIQLGNSLQSFVRLQSSVLKIKAKIHCLFCWIFSIWDNRNVFWGVYISIDVKELAYNHQPYHKHYIAVRF